MIRFLLVCGVLFAVVWIIAVWFSPAPPEVSRTGSTPQRPPVPPRSWRLQKGALLYALTHAGGVAIVCCAAYALIYAFGQDWLKTSVFGGLGVVLTTVAGFLTSRRPWLRAENGVLVWKPAGMAPPQEIRWEEIESVSLPWNYWLTGLVILHRRRGQPRQVKIKATPLGVKPRHLAALLRRGLANGAPHSH